MTVSESALSRCADDLEACLTKETHSYQQLLKLDLEARQALERHDEDRLADLLKQRHELITDLRRNANNTDKVRTELSGYQNVPPEIQTRVSSALKRTGDALRELLELERTNEESVRAVKDSIESELRELGRGRQVLERYRVPCNTDPLFMDKRR